MNTTFSYIGLNRHNKFLNMNFYFSDKLKIKLELDIFLINKM